MLHVDDFEHFVSSNAPYILAEISPRSTFSLLPLLEETPYQPTILQGDTLLITRLRGAGFLISPLSLRYCPFCGKNTLELLLSHWGYLCKPCLEFLAQYMPPDHVGDTCGSISSWAFVKAESEARVLLPASLRKFPWHKVIEEGDLLRVTRLTCGGQFLCRAVSTNWIK